MNRKIIYLLNPISGTSGREDLIRIIVEKTEARGILYEILPTNAAGDYQDLANRIRQESISDIVVCGGDGSVSAVTAQLLGLPVNIGIIPLGSGNGLALAASIPTEPAEALEIIFAGFADFIDGFYINQRFSCMLAGIGFDAQVAADFAHQRKRGLQTYIRISAINYLKAPSYAFEITVDDMDIAARAFFISVANGNQFGNHFTIAPKASLNDGLLDIVVVKQMNKLLLPFSVLGQVTGMNTLKDVHDFSSDANIFYFQTAALSIFNPEAAPMHIDGDPGESSDRFEIRIMPRAFRLIQPDPQLAV